MKNRTQVLPKHQSIPQNIDSFKISSGDELTTSVKTIEYRCDDRKNVGELKMTLVPLDRP
jgi:hypothetical protein